VDSEYPLSEPDNAVADTEILGLWRNAADGTKKPLRIEPVNADGLPKGLMRAIVADNPSAQPLFLWSTRIGDYAYLNIPCTDSSEKGRVPLDGNNPAEYHKWRKSEKRPVLLMMVERDGDEMLVWGGGPASQRITGDRKETLAALARDPKNFFNSKPDRFARVSDVAINGSKNAVTDEVSDEEPSREPPEWYKQRETPDPNIATLEIERLTPEQARQLVAEKNADRSGDPYLVLGLTELDAETARQLAMFEGHTLGLPVLTKLDAKTANALAEFKGFIWLDGLTSLDPLTAKEIAGFRGDTKHPLIAESPTGLKGDTRNTLKLDGLKTLDANTAAALAEFEGRAILLQGVTTLDAAAAESLAKFNGDVLYLTRLKLRDANVAKALANFKGKELHVQLPDAADTDVAKALAEFEGEMPLLEPAVVNKVRSYRVRQDLRQLVADAGFESEGHKLFSNLKDYFLFGSKDAKKKHAAGDEFDRLEVKNACEEHRSLVGRKKLVLNGLAIEAFVRDDVETMGLLVKVALPMRVTVNEGVFHGSLAVMHPCDCNQGSFAFLTKDNTLRPCNWQEVAMVKRNAGIIYIAEMERTQLMLFIQDSLESLKAIARNSGDYKVSIDFENLEISKPFQWGFFRESDLMDADWDCDRLRRRQDLGLDREIAPAYFMTKGIGDTPAILQCRLTGLRVVEKSGKVVGAYSAGDN
jgi:hypothetical protein